MSRRRAVGLMGAAFGAAAVPALKPRSARAAGEGCDAPGLCTKGTVCGFEAPLGTGRGCNKGCCQNTGDPVADRANAVCCNQDKRGSWCCPSNHTCGSGANTEEDPNCTCAHPLCAGACCAEDEECLPGKGCQPKCPPNQLNCGNGKCCEANERCCAGAPGGCCQVCCGDYCCTTGYSCTAARFCNCNASNTCKNGRCCPDGAVCCGSGCCLDPTPSDELTRLFQSLSGAFQSKSTGLSQFG